MGHWPPHAVILGCLLTQPRWLIFASFNKMDDFSGRLLLFRIGDLACAAPATTVREILPPQRATRIPGAPPPVEGLINVRGELVTLVDGARLLGRGPGVDGGALVLLEWAATTVALAADEVLDLVPLGSVELEAREELVGIDPGVVQAVGRHAGRSFVVLALDALLGPLLTVQEDV